MITNQPTGLIAAIPLGLMMAIMAAPPASAQQNPKLDIAAIYFPSWHRDDHYSAWFGEGFTEWQLVERNPSRFPGHEQIKPVWGYFDEADPKVMARQIDAAADNGVNVFIFDWYWYSGVKFIHRAVEEGFRRAPNRSRMKYALMWANHPWVVYYPVPYKKPGNWLLHIHHSPADFDRVMQHCIETHFNQPEYWRVDGGLYFSIFAPEDFIKQLGGPEKTRAVFDAAREKVAKAGLGKMHFAAFTGIPQSVPNCIAAGFDSLTSYNVTTMSSKLKMPKDPFEEYDAMIQRHEKYWAIARATAVSPSSSSPTTCTTPIRSAIRSPCSTAVTASARSRRATSRVANCWT